MRRKSDELELVVLDSGVTIEGRYPVDCLEEILDSHVVYACAEGRWVKDAENDGVGVGGRDGGEGWTVSAVTVVALVLAA